LSLWEQEQNEAGKLARRIVRRLDSLWTFLEHEGVEPTNNRAERALRSRKPAAFVPGPPSRCSQI